MDDDYIPQPRPRLTDEAAAQVLDFFYDLVADFESAYAAQILRHWQVAAEESRNSRQLPPFVESDGDPF